MTEESGPTQQTAGPAAVQASAAADTAATPGRTASRTALAYEHDWTAFQAWCRKAYGCHASAERLVNPSAP